MGLQGSWHREPTFAHATYPVGLGFQGADNGAIVSHCCAVLITGEKEPKMGLQSLTSASAFLYYTALVPTHPEAIYRPSRPRFTSSYNMLGLCRVCIGIMDKKREPTETLSPKPETLP